MDDESGFAGAFAILAADRLSYDGAYLSMCEFFVSRYKLFYIVKSQTFWDFSAKIKAL